MVEQANESFGRLGAQRRAQRRSGLWFNAYHRLANKLAVFCTVLVLLLLLMSIFANFIAPYPYDEAHFDDPYIFPSRMHAISCGTDSLAGICSAVSSMAVACRCSWASARSCSPCLSVCPWACWQVCAGAGPTISSGVRWTYSPPCPIW